MEDRSQSALVDWKSAVKSEGHEVELDRYATQKVIIKGTLRRKTLSRGIRTSGEVTTSLPGAFVAGFAPQSSIPSLLDWTFRRYTISVLSTANAVRVSPMARFSAASMIGGGLKKSIHNFPPSPEGPRHLVRKMKATPRAPGTTVSIFIPTA